MKKLLIFAFLLQACATSPSQEEADMSQPEPTTSAAGEPDAKPLPVVTTDPPPAQKATLNELDDAIRTQNDDKIYKQASTLLLQNPQDLKALNALALYHYKKGRFSAAKYFLSKALQVKETSELYNNLGVVHLAVGEKKEATLAFRQALGANPKDGAAGANLGAILVSNQSYINASVWLESAYNQGYRDARVLNNYAIALTATGKGAEAASLYEKALKEQSQNKEILLNYSILLIENLKKPKEGLEILNRLKFVGPTQGQQNRIKDLENRAKLGLQ